MYAYLLFAKVMFSNCLNEDISVGKRQFLRHKSQVSQPLIILSNCAFEFILCGAGTKLYAQDKCRKMTVNDHVPRTVTVVEIFRLHYIHERTKFEKTPSSGVTIKYGPRDENFLLGPNLRPSTHDYRVSSYIKHA